MTTFNFVNCTPHAITLNDGTVYPTTDYKARVSASYSDFDNLICNQTFGDIIDLPAPKDNTYYIVSSIVLSAAKSIGRMDCVAPATGHPDCIRKDGFIVSVPGFVR